MKVNDRFKYVYLMSFRAAPRLDTADAEIYAPSAENPVLFKFPLVRLEYVSISGLNASLIARNSNFVSIFFLPSKFIQLHFPQPLSTKSDECSEQ